MRNEQLVRALSLIRILEGCRRPHPFRELACLLNVTERTIRRDLEALESAGAIVERGVVEHELGKHPIIAVTRFTWPSSRRASA